MNFWQVNVRRLEKEDRENRKDWHENSEFVLEFKLNKYRCRWRYR